MAGFDVMDQQAGMTFGTGPGAGNGARRPSPMSDGILGELGDAIDETPRWVAAFIAGALIALILMRFAGFRFSFGATVGGS